MKNNAHTSSSSNRPLVSVVMPYYNDDEHITETLQSCLDNTYSNIEIIIIDDCSDIALKIEDLNIDTQKRLITTIRNSSNKGPGYSRNLGIKMANGELIAFLDSDDLWMPEIVEKQVDVFHSDPKVVWVYTDGYYLINNKKVRKPNSAYQGFNGRGFPIGYEVNQYHLMGYNYMTFSSNMFKKDVLIGVGLFNEQLDVSEDWDLFARVAEKYPVHAINKPLMYYRINPSGRHFMNRKDDVQVNVSTLEGMYKRQGLFPSRVKDYNKAVALIYQRAGIHRMNNGVNREARKYLFHPKAAPLQFQFRMVCVRILSFLPSKFYKLALWLFDHM